MPDREQLLAESRKTISLQDEVADGVHAVDDADHGFFARGRDFEAVGDAHTYTESEQALLASFESLAYLPPNNAIYRSYLANPSEKRPSQASRCVHR